MTIHSNEVERLFRVGDRCARKRIAVVRAARNIPPSREVFIHEFAEHYKINFGWLCRTLGIEPYQLPEKQEYKE